MINFLILSLRLTILKQVSQTDAKIRNQYKRMTVLT